MVRLLQTHMNVCSEAEPVHYEGQMPKRLDPVMVMALTHHHQLLLLLMTVTAILPLHVSYIRNVHRLDRFSVRLHRKGLDYDEGCLKRLLKELGMKEMRDEKGMK